MTNPAERLYRIADQFKANGLRAEVDIEDDGLFGSVNFETPEGTHPLLAAHGMIMVAGRSGRSDSKFLGCHIFPGIGREDVVSKKILDAEIDASTYVRGLDWYVRYNFR